MSEVKNASKDIDNEKEDTKSNNDEVTEVTEVEEEDLEKIEIINEDAENQGENNVNLLGKGKKIAELEKKVEDLQNKILRTQADFENYKKRTIAEKSELVKNANIKLISELLPTYDNFDRSIQASRTNDDFQSFVDGVEIVYRQLDETLKKEGLSEIDSVGKPFDPEFQQAVMQVETDEYDSNVVVEELQKGYTLNGKVIRPAMVKVSV